MPATTALLTPPLRRVRDHLLRGLGDALAPDDAFEADSLFDAGYTQAHVEECGRIIDDLFSSLEQVQGREAEVGKVVRATVDRLNDLNERTDCALIELEQRDDLCELINAGARQAGLRAADEEDITEAWREW